MDSELLKELVGFLQDPKPEVKILALQHLAGISQDEESIKTLKQTNIVTYLLRLITDSNHVISRHSLTILINLCSDADMLSEITKKNIVPRLVDGSTDSKNKLSEIYSMLLSNVTHTKEGCLQLMQAGKELEAFYIMKLVQVLLQDSNSSDYLTTPKHSWIINIILNVTQIQEGRKIVLDKDNLIFQSLLPLIHHKDLVKRRGIVGIIRNCCFSEIHQEYILTSEAIDILTIILLPIRGNDRLDDDEMKGMSPKLQNSEIPLDNQREQDKECRKMLIDSLIFLTKTKKAREYMREKKAYPIIRNYYNKEDDEEIKENIEKVVEILLRDEEETDQPTDTNNINNNNNNNKLEDEDATFDVEEI
ncbi:armadillo-like helical domain-containing protein [Tieghemostelium lacteum]|uniref:Protein HGH1 homolog n=1 Tax=Tieghemostelium lacteum TaxID=361077 RepID=A0A151ZDU9_TIELA|nr:armadillo-like helical domain-containing protein [Tieghemostelium lacteum]|eukprot:KYQ92105.1 armadillo-like helical domain-containing protein [Tieghemostelium lacteum]